MFLICPIVCFVAVWLVIPLILLAIFSNPRIRQETRYLLLANLLLSDLIYVSLYTLCTCFNAGAKGTFLIHYILLFLSFCPLLLIVVETLLYSHDLMEIRTGMWVTLTNCNMLMILPKALTPYLYGFRYKEISKPLKAFYRLKCPRQAVSPVTANPE
ncbi:probable G-protein coupled receptor 148 [Polyodon spathula]|uniref:probable G-protein coupled receptor 148 n=1 Tax=Polyodon spathula TaxID=7913 RepID=UPI001B7F7608|nr:probable G-protein coupled receptor 148 [Polyodon spathula]